MNRKALYAATALLLLFSACELLGPKSGTDAGPDGKAAVRVAIAVSGAQARTVFPVVKLEDATAWELWGGEPGEEPQDLLADLSGTGETVYLATGDWDFTVKGYNGDGALILQGTLTEQTISLDGPDTLTFTVAPHKDGEGTFAITIELPAGHGITKAEVWKDDSLIKDGLTPKDDDTVVFEDNYPAGDYYFIIRLYKDGALYGVVSETAQVRANLRSEKPPYTLTAADLKMVYRIDYHLYDGTLESPNPGYYRSTDAGFPLPPPTRKGYEFKGWHADTKDGAKATDIPQESEGDKNFHAEWKIIEYDIIYYLYDGSNHGDNPAKYTVVSPSFTLKDPTREGAFRFNGWYDDADFNHAANITITTGDTGERTFHAQWIRQDTITFDPRGGSAVTAITRDTGAQVAKPIDPTWGVSQFNGWFNEAGVEYDWPYTPTGDVTMYAQWKHPVTFHPNDGNPPPNTQYVVEGVEADDPGAMTKALDLDDLPDAGLYTGLTFGGWYNDPDCEDNLWDFEDPVTEPLELYAKWTAEPVDIDDQDSDNILAQALSYIGNQPDDPTNYTIVLDGNSGTYTMAGVTSANISKTNAVITLVGKGNEPTKISLTSNGSLFYIGAGELVLDNNITLKGINPNTYPLVYVDTSSSTLTMKAETAITDNVRINNVAGGAGVYITGGTFNMEGGTISGNSSTTNSAYLGGGGVYSINGTFNMEGGTISGNSSTTNGNYTGGGGVYVWGGTFNMRNGTISRNSTSATGGGVYAHCTFNMSGGEISGNRANIGAGVYISPAGSLNKTGLSVIYGDTDTTFDNDDTHNNTSNGMGHAAFHQSFTGYYKYRNDPLSSGVNITTDTDDGWILQGQ